MIENNIGWVLLIVAAVGAVGFYVTGKRDKGGSTGGSRKPTDEEK